MQYCPNCGKQVIGTPNFCGACGYNLKAQQSEQPLPETKCPICGSKTVVRTAVIGPDTGLKFHVCIRFPECKGRIPVEEELELSDIFDTDETRERGVSMRNYSSAKSVSTTLKVLSVIVLVIGLGTMIWVALTMHDVGASASDMTVVLLEYLLVVVVSSVLVLAAGFVIDILINIARSSSKTADLLAKRFKRD